MSSPILIKDVYECKLGEIIQEKDSQIKTLTEELAMYQQDEGYYQEFDVCAGKLIFKVDNLLLLEVMEELTRVLKAGKSRTVINHLKSL